MDKASKSQGKGRTASHGIQKKSEQKRYALLVIGLIVLAALFYYFKTEHTSPALVKEPPIGNQDLSVATIQSINGDGQQKPESSEQWYQTDEGPKELSPKTSTVHYLRVIDVYRRVASHTILRKLSSHDESTLSAPLPLTVSLQAYPIIPIPMGPEGARVHLSVSNNNESFKGYLFEASTNPQFKTETVAIKWSSSATIDINIKKPGTFYYRTRGVNKSNELTPLSTTASFTVYDPTPAPIIHAQAHSQQKVDGVMNPEHLKNAETRSPSSRPDKNTQITTIAAPALDQQVSNKISWWGQLQQNTSLIHYEGENWTKLERINQDILGGSGELTVGMWLPQSRWGFAGSYAFSGFLLKKDLLFYQNAAIMAGYKSHLLGGFFNIWTGAGYHQFPELTTKNFLATAFSGENNSSVGLQSKLEYLLPLRNRWGLRTTGNVFWGPLGISSADRGTVSESYEYSFGVHLTYNYDNFITGMLGYTYQAGFASYPSDPTNTTYNSSHLQGHYLGLTLLLNPTALELKTKK